MEIFSKTPALKLFFAENRRERPTFFHSLMNSICMYPCNFGPILNAPFLSVIFYYYVCPFIPILLFIGSPSTIRWLIITVIINPIYGHSFLRISHIFIEIFETQPSITNTYPSFSVVFKLFIVSIFTSLNNAFPSVVSSAAPLSMLFERFRHFLSMQTPARFRFSISDSNKKNPLFGSARTPTKSSSESFRWLYFKNGPPFNFLPYFNVFNLHITHRTTPLLLRSI